MGDDAFDLCCRCCARNSYYRDEHLRVHPHHDLQLVTPFCAPIRAAPKPPPPPPPPVAADHAARAGGELVREEDTLVANTKYHWTQTTEEVNLTVCVGLGVTRKNLRVAVRPRYLRVEAFDGAAWRLLLGGGLHRPVMPNDAVWTLQRSKEFDGSEIQMLLPKSELGSVSRLFASEEPLHPAMALKQVCDDEPYDGHYMDLPAESRQIVDTHRLYRHAKATGKTDLADELEEDMKMMRFNWKDGQ